MQSLVYNVWCIFYHHLNLVTVVYVSWEMLCETLTTVTPTDLCRQFHSLSPSPDWPLVLPAPFSDMPTAILTFTAQDTDWGGEAQLSSVHVHYGQVVLLEKIGYGNMTNWWVRGYIHVEGDRRCGCSIFIRVLKLLSQLFPFVMTYMTVDHSIQYMIFIVI